ncbi:MAG: hypothetical protein QM820_58335 [Minicystis sp.]
MQLRHLAGLFSCAVMLVACGGASFDPTDAEDTGEAASAASYDDNSVVGRQGDGVFRNASGMEVTITESGPSRTYYVDWGYWIDIYVENLAYDKSVGVIWTQDGWATANVSYATYETDLGGGYERWGVDSTGRSYAGYAPTVEYATFATMNGDTYYGKEDNWKNYVIHP